MAKTLAIMQPYFLPYMGYWQLINAVDEFVIYDTIQYTKKGWINRNRFLMNGTDEVFSLPLKKDSDFLFVRDRELAPSFERDKLIRQLKGAYQKAPYFSDHFPIIEDIINFSDNNLFTYVENSIHRICQFLDIKTPLIKSSDIQTGHEKMKGTDKVIDICQSQNAANYMNPIGGLDLYNKNTFQDAGIHLSFLRSTPLDYQCFGAPCLPHMSILDVMMFCPKNDITSYLTRFEKE